MTLVVIDGGQSTRVREWEADLEETIADVIDTALSRRPASSEVADDLGAWAVGLRHDAARRRGAGSSGPDTETDAAAWFALARVAERCVHFAGLSNDGRSEMRQLTAACRRAAGLPPLDQSEESRA